MDTGKGIEIDMLEPQARSGGDIQLPLNFVAVGELEHDDLRIYIRQSTYQKLEDYAASDRSKELGSILIGDYVEEMGKIHVVVSDYIEARFTDASASSLTFTHETWDYIHGEHERLYPQKRIIGWQHTHPNYGIFLSSHDLFIQENFFNLPFQIAYVIDPVQSTRGFFQWKKGKTGRLEGFYIYDEIGKVIKSRPAREKTAAAGPKTSHKGVVALLLLLLALLAGTIGYMLMANQALEEDNQRLERSLQEYAREQSALRSELSQAIDAQGQEIAGMKGQMGAGNNGPETVSFRKYVVKSGDSLRSICQAYGIDFEANADIIKGINAITDFDQIRAGQAILLPVQ